MASTLAGTLPRRCRSPLPQPSPQGHTHPRVPGQRQTLEQTPNSSRVGAAAKATTPASATAPTSHRRVRHRRTSRTIHACHLRTDRRVASTDTPSGDCGSRSMHRALSSGSRLHTRVRATLIGTRCPMASIISDELCVVVGSPLNFVVCSPNRAASPSAMSRISALLSSRGGFRFLRTTIYMGPYRRVTFEPVVYLFSLAVRSPCRHSPLRHLSIATPALF